MRCDVCYTRIPLGESRCPNCGMVMKKESSVTLTSEPENKRTMRKPHIKTYSSPSRRQRETKVKITSILSVISSIIIFIVIGFGIISDITSPDFNIDVPSFNVGYDISAYEEFLDMRKDDLTQMGYTVSEDSSVSLYSTDNRYKVEIHANKDEKSFTINYIFEDSSVILTSLDIYGSTEDLNNPSYIILNENELNKLGQFLEFDNLYGTFKDSYHKMVVDINNTQSKFYSGYYKNYEIYVSETLNSFTNQLEYTYSISK